ncbi:unnamed protein product [Schistosoma mattheei]|uniref:Uncharacterized protein n=1 Tax=Schistosoma mattheei TaxID=31246 RepID=A0A183PHE2_9TREM|nr:unnamed protein product [Schistosoma mattheei]
MMCSLMMKNVNSMIVLDIVIIHNSLVEVVLQISILIVSSETLICFVSTDILMIMVRSSIFVVYLTMMMVMTMASFHHSAACSIHQMNLMGLLDIKVNKTVKLKPYEEVIQLLLKHVVLNYILEVISLVLFCTIIQKYLTVVCPLDKLKIVYSRWLLL